MGPIEAEMTGRCVYIYEARVAFGVASALRRSFYSTLISATMKSVLAAGLFSGLAAAHSAAWSVTVDGAKFVDLLSWWQI